jgi:hypothetical protein
MLSQDVGQQVPNSLGIVPVIFIAIAADPLLSILDAEQSCWTVSFRPFFSPEDCNGATGAICEFNGDMGKLRSLFSHFPASVG